MNINCCGIINDSIVDGDGYRLTVFVQGCPHHCKGCHNPSSWEFKTNELVPIDDIMDTLKSNPLLSGITFSGGEPFSQPLPLIKIAQETHNLGKDIWCYTGYTLDQLLGTGIPEQIELLNNIDFLVDGPFILEQRDLSLRFRGSKNQRIIDMRRDKPKILDLEKE